jgi:hypothetical protein
MFRLIIAFLIALLAGERARQILASGRTLGDPGVGKATDPLGFWVVAVTHTCFAILFSLLTVWLIYNAVAGTGTYADTPFFSWSEHWTLVLASVALVVLTYQTFAKRLRRLVSAQPNMHRKTFRQKRRRGK